MGGGEALVRSALSAFNDRRWDEFGGLYAEDATISYPQSGEHFVGKKNIQALVEAFPNAPTFHVASVDTDGDLVVVHADIDYGSEPLWKGCFLYVVGDGMIRREVAYFAEPFPAAEWRAPFRAA